MNDIHTHSRTDAQRNANTFVLVKLQRFSHVYVCGCRYDHAGVLL